jgi:hypothetical protein
LSPLYEQSSQFLRVDADDQSLRLYVASNNNSSYCISKI